MRLVAVIGAGQADAALAEQARQVGGVIARLGFGLVTGGLGGVMEAASAGYAAARDAGDAGASEARSDRDAGSLRGPGVVVGLLPGADRSAANPHVDVAIPTGLGRARNQLVVLSAEAVVAVGGESGTLSEIALAWQEGRPICAFTPAGGWGARLAGEALNGKRQDRIDAVDSSAALADWLRHHLGAGGPAGGTA